MFVEGAKVVMDVVSGDGVFNQEKIRNWLCEEFHFIDDMVSQVCNMACELYNCIIYKNISANVFYDRRLTESRHYRVLRYVSAFLRLALTDHQLGPAWQRVQRYCNNRFRAKRNRCLSLSISGVQCCLLSHKTPGEYIPGVSMNESLRGRSLIHCSGYSYTSTCSCGKTQKKRLDPFTAKEANYDFYSQFPCCAKLENMPFGLYNPGIKWDVSSTRSVIVKKPEKVSKPLNNHSRARNHQIQPQYLFQRKTDDQSSLSSLNRKEYTTFTVVKPKSQSRMLDELTWQFNQMMHEHRDLYLRHMWHSGTPKLVEEIKEHVENEEEPSSDEMSDSSSSSESKSSSSDLSSNFEMNGVIKLTNNDINKSKSDENVKDIKSNNTIVDENVRETKVSKLNTKLIKETLLLPLYPSWAVHCTGMAKHYVHSHGLKDQPGFVKGSDSLLPWDVNIHVKSERWFQDLKELLKVDRLPWREKRLEQNVELGTHREKVKLFVGFEYECPLGHRFLCEKANKMLQHDKSTGQLKTDAAELVAAELPLYMTCKCSSPTLVVNAQLMRIHIVTPKAPVSVRLDPHVKLGDDGYFHMGQRADLNWGRVYVLRFPFIYEGAHGLIRKPETSPSSSSSLNTASILNGVLLPSSIQVCQKES